MSAVLRPPSLIGEGGEEINREEDHVEGLPARADRTNRAGGRLELPEEVQVAVGDLAGSKRERLLALSVSVGMRVMSELIEEEFAAICGAKGKHDPERGASRHGGRQASVVLGGRRVRARRPRARTVDCARRPNRSDRRLRAGGPRLAGPGAPSRSPIRSLKTGRASVPPLVTAHKRALDRA